MFPSPLYQKRVTGRACVYAALVLFHAFFQALDEALDVAARVHLLSAGASANERQTVRSPFPDRADADAHKGRRSNYVDKKWFLIVHGAVSASCDGHVFGGKVEILI